MFATAIRQLRMVSSIVLGKRINPRNIEHLIGDAVKTIEEFGTLGDDIQQQIEGPFGDPATRKDLQNGALQRTARHLARSSPYYRRLFAAHNINPEKLTADVMSQIPVTTRKELMEHQRDFITTDSRPFLAARTTGTTGLPAEVWVSKYEIELWPALNALSMLLRDEIDLDGCLQINISSRATVAARMMSAMCGLVGAGVRALGIIPPCESVDSLLCDTGKVPTMLSTHPSYLAQLVQEARYRKLRPYDFHLRHVYCGGEVLSNALLHAAKETLGAEFVHDNYGMTEILPVTARACNQGHLHHDVNTGFFEVRDLETGEPAEPGALGSLIITPYYPYRECMPVFRYDTRDVVRCLSGETFACNMAAIPATSRILGKVDHLLYTNEQIITPREFIETYESLPSQPWPARFQARSTGDFIELVLSEQALDGMTEDDVEQHFQAAGISVHVIGLVARQQERYLRSLRADLLETTFTHTGPNQHQLVRSDSKELIL
jgi:phenylacetate-coenzyme A ligase PaaK-like adenylate-forming protein